MAYKKQLIILSSLVGTLALIYVLLLFFDADRSDRRSSAYVWLAPEWAAQADRMELRGRNGDSVTLVRTGGTWFVDRDGQEYPAKQGRIGDLLQILSAKAPYPVRGNSDSAHERLGVSGGGGDGSSRILVRGGASAYPLLDLIVGTVNASGQELYLRREGQNEVRSGQDRFTAYTESNPSSWLNLRLFQDSENLNLSPDMVQQLRVSFLADENSGEGEGTGAGTGPRRIEYTLSRAPASGWVILGQEERVLNSGRVDSYVRSILDAEGEDYVPAAAAPPSFSGGTIVIQLGDGTSRNIRFGPPAGDSPKTAMVSGSSLVYALSEWTMDRLLREPEYFLEN